MGTDKSELIVQGEPLAHRLARLLKEGGWSPTVLGRTPLPGFPFIGDATLHGGPLMAIQGFVPVTDWVFILACDIPLFRCEVAESLMTLRQGYEAVVPVLAEKRQPLCALYHRTAWDRISEPTIGPRMQDWLARLNVREVDENSLHLLSIDANWVRGANRPSEFDRLLRR
jgi:molybdopterin-guanine dinucleotide biosynthesis protein A